MIAKKTSILLHCLVLVGRPTCWNILFLRYYLLGTHVLIGFWYRLAFILLIRQNMLYDVSMTNVRSVWNSKVSLIFNPLIFYICFAIIIHDNKIYFHVEFCRWICRKIVRPYIVCSCWMLWFLNVLCYMCFVDHLDWIDVVLIEGDQCGYVCCSFVNQQLLNLHVISLQMFLFYIYCAL